MSRIPLGSLGGVPITVSVWYLILVGYAGLNAGPVLGVLWALVLTVSLLVHEFGHAALASRYRLNPSVRLEVWGGSCAHDRADSDAEDVAILIAGPAAGLVLGGLSWCVRWALQAYAFDTYRASPILMTGLEYLIWVNLFWTGINLLPVWPLDGGRLFRIGMLRLTKPLLAERITHVIGTLFAAGGVAWTATHGFSRFGILLAGVVGWLNIQALRGNRASGPIRGQSKFTKELLGKARDAYEAERWDEAARYCHQIRTEPRVSPRLLSETWRMLGLATARLGKPGEAASYLRRAELDDEVAETCLQCLAEIDDTKAMSDLLESDAWLRLRNGDAIATRVAERTLGRD